MLFLIVSVALGGLVIGGLGRLVVPGPQRIGCLATIAVGLLGAFVGGAIARALYADPGRHAVVSLILEVGVAAAVVAVLSGRRRIR
ncbi:MAG: GlsB/YeaQ/YmgE family stress response membrane protein [Acidimicrobiales bacterium]